ncbi:MAG TPA: 2-amino-4-hydroxy-6-hydroxymethyldihydropteridine diphosphokinase [Qipengyuania sp.]|nr:2-amino-4-hydroxy-6-hydroxymethyldihydropteridine diphosphokinase [Qipengyuania sp.]
MRVPGVGGPRQVLSAALAALEAEGLKLEAVSPILATAPIGPSLRHYANAVAVVASDRDPSAVLVLLQRIERVFGRKRCGERWRARPLDLDIVMWSGGVWIGNGLVIPHLRFRERRFVLAPAAAIAARWRDPVTGLTVKQLRARLTRNRQLPSCEPRSGP